MERLLSTGPTPSSYFREGVKQKVTLHDKGGRGGKAKSDFRDRGGGSGDTPKFAYSCIVNKQKHCKSLLFYNGVTIDVHGPPSEPTSNMSFSLLSCKAPISKKFSVFSLKILKNFMHVRECIVMAPLFREVSD